ncbi:MAG: class I SAM-dependent methyltransferase [Gemmatimonadaceae bacterium]|nr:class I SAM-dependent methyltransferase [Acetobacteraceae bacterium]
MSKDWRALNQANWDERTPLHLSTYDLRTLRAGRGRLTAIEEAELGPVEGLRVLHLQCHIGDDTLALAQRGALMTGIDFSPASIAAARGLAKELGVEARFVLSDVYGALDALPEHGAFDLVYTTWGTTTWLPDIRRWAAVVAAYLRPGGALYFADGHPAAFVFDDMAGTDPDGRPGWFAPYFGRQPVVVDSAADYADPAARLVNREQVNWIHPVGDVLAALQDAGLRLDWLREHPRVAWQMFGCLVRDLDGMWTWPDKAWLPLAISLRAVRI